MGYSSLDIGKDSYAWLGQVNVAVCFPAFCKESRRLYADAPGRSVRCSLNAGAGTLVVLPLFSAIVYKYSPVLARCAGARGVCS